MSRQSPWTPEKLAELRRLLAEAQARGERGRGHGYIAGIAAELGLPHKAVANKILSFTATDDTSKIRCERPTVRRACLCCSGQFDSEGPHDRLCQECRRQSRGTASLAEWEATAGPMVGLGSRRRGAA